MLRGELDYGQQLSSKFARDDPQRLPAGSIPYPPTFQLFARIGADKQPRKAPLTLLDSRPLGDYPANVAAASSSLPRKTPGRTRDSLEPMASTGDNAGSSAATRFGEESCELVNGHKRNRPMIRVGHPCGLFNRVDVITTAYVLARVRGEEEIEIVWEINDRHMPIGFRELFTSLPLGRVVEENLEPEVAQSYLEASSTLPADYRDSEYYGEMLRRLLANVVPDVLSEVTAFTDRHFHPGGASGGTTIGVHVRRSEHPLPLCPYAQPLRYYEAVLRSFPEGTRFFVSTDSQEAFRWLQARFGDRVFQRPKVHDNRSSVAGIREGLIDMLLLSRCSAIVGTYGSSFSGVAAMAGKRPVLMLKAFPRIPHGWPSFSRSRWLWAYRHVFVEATMWRRWYIWVARPQLVRIPRIPARCIRIVRSYASAIRAPQATGGSGEGPGRR